MPLIFSSCMSVKPSATKGKSNNFETFYVGNEDTQYFIKPLTFKEENTDNELLVDFTFKYKTEIKDSTIVNFSIKSSYILKSIDSLKFSNRNVDINSSVVNLIFNEKNSNGFTSRFTLKKIKDLFDNDEWTIHVITNTSDKKYIPERKTKKTIVAIKDEVFVLM